MSVFILWVHLRLALILLATVFLLRSRLTEQAFICNLMVSQKEERFMAVPGLALKKLLIESGMCHFHTNSLTNTRTTPKFKIAEEQGIPKYLETVEYSLRLETLPPACGIRTLSLSSVTLDKLWSVSVHHALH